MPRRRRPRPSQGRPLQFNQTSETRGGRQWHVRRLTGATSHKAYVCPGCHREIPAGMAHVVVWPDEATSFVHASGVDERRHWHTACWERG
ncbi:MAG: hypothetical protein QM621_13300 [Aeromicrobium sp.]|uniref:hypothetical protein n=1 Tax=Aeromicrobium sp. TaxID=1871063 RepID=UPI0039E6BABE